MNSIQNAFQKVKIEIEILKKEMFDLKKEIGKTRDQMGEICEILLKRAQKSSPTHMFENKTTSADTSANLTANLPFKSLKDQNKPFSIGNEGVSTDRQTLRQTDRHNFFAKNSIETASEIINSLDNIKKEIRLKFKQLTNQEFLVFSTIYQLDEELGSSNYKILSKQLNLTESSIRDYITRIIKKGIPIEKTRINNKTINLKISYNFKKIASLSTILQLRGL